MAVVIMLTTNCLAHPLLCSGVSSLHYNPQPPLPCDSRHCRWLTFVLLCRLCCAFPLLSLFCLQALTAALYAVSGVRGVEIGSSCFGHVDEETGEFIPARLELMRLALPRRSADPQKTLHQTV